MTESCADEFPLQANKDLLSSVIERCNNVKKIKNEMNVDSQISKLVSSMGTKAPPLWPFAPTKRHILPDLRVFLGIWNEMKDNFLDFTHERTEVTPEETIEVQTFSMMHCISLKRSEECLEKSQEDLRKK